MKVAQFIARLILSPLGVFIALAFWVGSPFALTLIVVIELAGGSNTHNLNRTIKEYFEVSVYAIKSTWGKA